MTVSILTVLNLIVQNETHSIFIPRWSLCLAELLVHTTGLTASDLRHCNAGKWNTE